MKRVAVADPAFDIIKPAGFANGQELFGLLNVEFQCSDEHTITMVLLLLRLMVKPRPPKKCDHVFI